MYNIDLGANGTRLENTRMVVLFFGAGITCYTIESFLLSASVGSGSFLMINEVANYKITTEGGPGFRLNAGKEWWVFPRFGLGLSIYYGYKFVNNQVDTGETAKIYHYNVGLVFSATFSKRK